MKTLTINWDKRIRKQAELLNKQTAQANRDDSELNKTCAEMRRIRAEYTRMKALKEKTDHRVTKVWEQQEIILRLLTSLEEAFPQGDDQRAQSCEREDRVDRQLEELKRQTGQLRSDIAEFHATSYSDPRAKVGSILDAYSYEMDALQIRVEAGERQLYQAAQACGI